METICIPGHLSWASLLAVRTRSPLVSFQRMVVAITCGCIISIMHSELPVVVPALGSVRAVRVVIRIASILIAFLASMSSMHISVGPVTPCWAALVLVVVFCVCSRVRAPFRVPLVLLLSVTLPSHRAIVALIHTMTVNVSERPSSRVSWAIWVGTQPLSACPGGLKGTSYAGPCTVTCCWWIAVDDLPPAFAFAVLVVGLTLSTPLLASLAGTGRM